VDKYHKTITFYNPTTKKYFTFQDMQKMAADNKVERKSYDNTIEVGYAYKNDSTPQSVGASTLLTTFPLL
jgi:hypothetical protein